MSYDPKQEYYILKLIIYLDANNLDGYAMSKLLPTSILKWIDPTIFDLNKDNTYSSTGCVLRAILNIQKNYLNYTMVILWLQMK